MMLWQGVKNNDAIFRYWILFQYINITYKYKYTSSKVSNIDEILKLIYNFKNNLKSWRYILVFQPPR